MSETSGSTQHGNVLFLILIAVVLFAALSFAVTNSSRTGGGDISRESDQTIAGSLVSYPTALTNAIMRMTTNGISAQDINFANPAAFGSLGAGDDREALFHPNGGGAFVPDQLTGFDSVGPGGVTVWYLVGNYEVKNIGTSTPADTDGNEILFVVGDVRPSLCRLLNEKAGLGATIPTITGDIAGDLADMVGNTLSWDAVNAGSPQGIIGTGGYAGSNVLDGQHRACFYETTGGLRYYYQVVWQQ